jgi:hypothetical protein
MPLLIRRLNRIFLVILSGLFLTCVLIVGMQSLTGFTSRAGVVNQNHPAEAALHPSLIISQSLYFPIIGKGQSKQDNTPTVISPTGGVVVAPNQQDYITFAQNAVSDTVRVTWRTQNVNFPYNNKRLRLIGRPFAIEIAEAANQPIIKFITDSVRIFVKYNDADIAGLDENLLGLFYLNEDTGDPIFLLTHVDPLNNILEAPLSGWPRWSDNSTTLRLAPMAIVPHKLITGTAQFASPLIGTQDISPDLVILDPDNNDDAEQVEGSKNLATAEAVKKLLENCDCDVLLTREDNINYHTYAERAQFINERRPAVALTIAYDAFSDPGATGPRRLRPTQKPEDTADINFGDLVKQNVCDKTGLSCNNSTLDRAQIVPNFVDDEIIVAHVELAYLTNPTDRLLIDSFPWLFTEAVFEAITTTMGKDCPEGPGCDPQQDGFSIPNQSLADDRAKVYQRTKVRYGSDSVEYQLDADAQVSGDFTLPVTPALTLPAPVSGTVPVSSTRRPVFPIEGFVVPKPIAYAQLQGASSLLFGERYPGLDPSASLEAGSCEGMMIMVAKFCAGELEPEDFGADTVAGIVKSELLLETIQYFQGVQDSDEVNKMSKEVPANQLIQEIMSLMDVPVAQPGNWRENMRIIRLWDKEAQCAEDEISVGHTVLPYNYDRSGNIITLKVFDPNFPQDTNRTVEFNLDTESWTYHGFPDSNGQWQNDMVGWVALSDIPEYGAELTPLYETDNMVVVNGGFNRREYPSRVSGYSRGRFKTEGLFGCIPVNDVPTFVNTITGAQRYQVNLGNMSSSGNNLYSLPGPKLQTTLTSTLVPEAFILPRGAYTIELEGTGGDTIADHAIFGNGRLFATSIEVSAATFDQLVTNEDFTEVKQTTNELSKTISASWYRDIGQATRVFGIGDTSLYANEFAIFRMDTTGEYPEYINEGSHPSTYNLGLAQVGVKGVSMFSLSGLKIKPHERQVITACNWKELENTFILQQRDYNNDGTIDEVEILSELPFFVKDKKPKVSAMAVSGHDYWIGTQSQGVIHYRSDTKTTEIYNTGNSGLSHNVINDIAIAPNGEVWVATNKGVNRFSGGNWQTYTEEDGLISDQVNTVVISPTGIVWLGTNKGISRYDGAWTSYTKANGLPHNKVTGLAVEGADTLWVVMANNTISRYNGSTWELIPGVPNGSIDSVTVTGNIIWFGTNQGLVKYEQGLLKSDTGVFTHINPTSINLNEVTPGETAGICGMLWVVSESGIVGLYDYELGTWLILP